MSKRQDLINYLPNIGLTYEQFKYMPDEVQGRLVELIEEKMKRAGLTNLTRIQFAKEHHVNHKYRKLDFNNRGYLDQIYKDESQRIVIKKAVQVGISEWALVDALYMAMEKGWSGAYILTKSQLRDDFVSERINPTLNHVPYYKEKVGATDNLNIKQLGRAMLRFLGSNATDNFLSFPADFIIVDEYDRCDFNNVAMAKDRLQASDFKYERWISNPTVEGLGIDRLYTDSNRQKYLIKCEHCNKYIDLDWFNNVVREVDNGLYELRDPKCTGDKAIYPICGYCERPINHLRQGEWVAEVEHDISGYTLSQLYSPTVTYKEMYEDFLMSMFNDTKSQIFWNNRLGLAYKAKGAKITLSMIERCEELYGLPYEYTGNNGVHMGVDVGSMLHCVIREQIADSTDVIRQRLLYVGAVNRFEELAELFHRYNVKKCCIDSYPELHKAKEFQSMYPDIVWLADYHHGSNSTEPVVVYKNKQLLRADRTSVIDAFIENLQKQTLIYPINSKDLCNGEYLKHVGSVTRIKKADKDTFFYVNSGDDHYLHAEVYCSLLKSLEDDGINIHIVDTGRRKEGREDVLQIGKRLQDDFTQRLTDFLYSKF